MSDIKNGPHQLYTLDLLNKQQMKSKEKYLKMYEIPLKAECFSVHNKMLLASINNCIKVYRFDSKMTLSLVKSFSKCSLVFTAKHLSNPAKTLMYKTVLDLVNKNVSIDEIEKYVVQLMDSLRFSHIVAVQYANQIIAIKYDNGIKYYDSRLAELKIDNEKAEEKIKEERRVQVKMAGESVVIMFENVSILKRKVGKVKLIDISENVVFLQQESKLIAISLN